MGNAAPETGQARSKSSLLGRGGSGIPCISSWRFRVWGFGFRA